MPRRQEKRSSRSRIEAHQDTRTPAPAGRPAGGIPPGGRRERPLTSPGGGRYPDSCSILKLRPATPGRGDPRLQELAAMGLPQLWVDVAEMIGVDNFLAMWRRFDREPSLLSDDDRLELHIRPYRSYLRFQRNRYIETLVDAGYSVTEIREAVKHMLGEDVSERHIYRLANGK